MQFILIFPYIKIDNQIKYFGKNTVFPTKNALMYVSVVGICISRLL